MTCTGAIRELTIVVKTNPSVLEVQYNLAVLLSQAGRYSEASEHFEIVHEKQPSDAAAAARLADCYFHTSRQDQARTLSSKSSASQSRFHDGYFVGF